MALNIPKFEVTKKLEIRRYNFESNYRVTLIEITTVETDNYTTVREDTKLHFAVDKDNGRVQRIYGPIEWYSNPFKFIGTKKR